MIGIKICGLTNTSDALAAVEAGADALGFVLAPSPRQVTLTTLYEIICSLPPFVIRVGVVTPKSEYYWKRLFFDGLIDLVQTHGKISAPEIPVSRVIKTLAVGKDTPYPVVSGEGRFRALLLDTYQPGLAGGTGVPFAWEEAESFRLPGIPLILAGGLRAENIRSALDIVRPNGVDVSSGVEKSLGRKDWRKMRTFVRTVREWEKEKSS